MEHEPAPKRRRVTRACENCRVLKSKCDGKPPTCNRCRGYGYTCRWRDKSTRVEALSKEPSELSQPLSLASPSNLQNKLDCSSTHSDQRTSRLMNRYLGEASDVSFYNTVRALLRSNAASGHDSLPLESYEREAAETLETIADTTVNLPDRKSADVLVDVYFSTIHVAYPFICRKQFMEDYQQFWELQLSTDIRLSFTPLLLTIFAIGSYYNVCAISIEEPGTTVHSIYFRRAVLAASHLETERSIEYVRVLLAQCFYLLATCQTDRCWMTLGFAVRIGQSIGLHVEEGRSQSPTRRSPVSQELRRRTWYSLFVLDQLLSLQLGRPPATHDSHSDVQRPSRLDDMEFDLANNSIPNDTGGEPKSGDYFINVIKFSIVIGHVIRDLFRPNCTDYSEDMLSRIDSLDAELLGWRGQLPRSLRFDRGHTFESSAVLKRQRNMLAIKFHHLRALIHRPCLCLPWLKKNSNIKDLLRTQSHRVVCSESICVAEAQETAHMLNDVTNTKSLVEDFPWWQMISCLMCASSILLVRRAFASSATIEEVLDREMLEEDAGTCLKVFDALSTSSDAARLARDMLYNLRNSKIPLDDSLINGTSQADEDMMSENLTAPPSTDVPVPESYPEGTSILQPGEELNNAASMWMWQDWPSEIADSMTWSSQFIDTLDPSVLSIPSYV